MMRLLVLAAIAIVAWRMFFGRWPWQPKGSARREAVARARKLLGLRAGANRPEIIEAHKRLVAMVHPDRGGTNEQVHEANAARDLLLHELPNSTKEIR
jgi:hypothetical protein